MQSWKVEPRGTQIVKTDLGEGDKTSSILIDEQSKSGFVATDSKIIIQINLQNQKIVKKYSNLGLRYIICLSSFENILCVAGKYGRLTLINFLEKRLLTIKPIKTLIKPIYSSQFTIINRNNHPIVSLIVSGSKLFLLYLHLNKLLFT